MPRGRDSIRTFAGPWRGMEYREAYRNDQHCELAVNVDFSRGDVEPREGIAEWNSNLDPDITMAYIHVTGNPTGARYVLVVGTSSDGTAVKSHVVGLNGLELGTTQNMTTTFGELPGSGWLCSFVDGSLPSLGEPEWCVFLTTQRGMYVFEVKDPTQGWRRVNTKEASQRIKVSNTSDQVVTFMPHRLATGDKIEIVGHVGSAPDINGADQAITVVDDFTFTIDGVTITTAGSGGFIRGGDVVKTFYKNWSYLTAPPTGYIAVAHQGKMAVAGFREGATFSLNNVLDYDQTEIDAGILSHDGGWVSYGPHFLLMSDVHKASFRPIQYASVEEGERITGLASYRENLTVLTENSIHNLTQDGGTLYRSVSGVGCAAHRSVIEVRGLLYFMGFDGVYVYDGSQAIKISKPLDWLFTRGTGRTHVPSDMRTLLATMGWPWRVNHRWLKLSCAVHYREKNQIWWSLPVGNATAAQKFGIILVWDYEHQAWSIYCQRSSTTTLMVDGVSVDAEVDGREFLLLTARLRVWSTGHAADFSNSVPVVWLSNRIYAAGDEVVKAFPRLKVLSKGKQPSTNPPTVYVESEETATWSGLGSSADVAAHPNATGDATGSAIWGDFTYGSTGNGGSNLPYEAVDWFTLEPEIQGQGRWVRLGIIDDGDTDSRPTRIHMTSFTMETSRGDPR